MHPYPTHPEQSSGEHYSLKERIGYGNGGGRAVAMLGLKFDRGKFRAFLNVYTPDGDVTASYHASPKEPDPESVVTLRRRGPGFMEKVAEFLGSVPVAPLGY